MHVGINFSTRRLTNVVQEGDDMVSRDDEVNQMLRLV